MSIQKINQSLEEQIKSNLSTPETIAQALIDIQFVTKNLKKLDAYVRKLAIVKLDDANEKGIDYDLIDQVTGEIKQFRVSRMPDSVTKEYRPERVMEAFGPFALNFMKVKKVAVDEFIKQGLKERAIDGEKAKMALSDPIEKVRKGGIVVKELK